MASAWVHVIPNLVPYASQRVAYWYFVSALALFTLQIDRRPLAGNQLRLHHPPERGRCAALRYDQGHAHQPAGSLDAAGFHGRYLLPGPREAEREIYSVKLAYFQLLAFLATGVAALIGFGFGWTQGKPLLEIPTPLDFIVVVGALIFLFNVAMTVIKGKRTAILGLLLGGLTLLSLLYLFGMPFYRNLSIDWFYWWWVVHLCGWRAPGSW